MAALSCAVAFACSAEAASRSAAMRVTANVEASCLVQSPSRVVAPGTPSIAQRIRVTCSQPVPHAVSIASVATVPSDASRDDPRLVVLVMY